MEVLRRLPGRHAELLPEKHPQPVELARPETAEAVHGIGTGPLAEHWRTLTDAGVPVFLSKLSSLARGVAPGPESGAQLAPPTKLVELAVWAETTLAY